MTDSTQTWQRDYDCEAAPEPLAVFPARSAPLGITYFDHASHGALRNSFLVALHGSFEPQMMSGYQIVRVEVDGTQSLFMDGFQLPDATRIARPMAFLQYDKNSFFFTDDHGGRIYFMRGQ